MSTPPARLDCDAYQSSGDINTQNNAERGFAVFAMLVGATTFGFIIGMISDIIQNSNIEKVRKKDPRWLIIP